MNFIAAWSYVCEKEAHTGKISYIIVYTST